MSSSSSSSSDSRSFVLDSTHIRHWVYTRDNLSVIRTNTNSSARRFIAEHVLPNQQRKESDLNSVDGTGAVESAGKGRKSKRSSAPLTESDLLTAEEERIVVESNVHKMMAMFPQMQQQRIPAAVESAAIQFFRRFFLYHSVMRFDITHIMLTSMFLASKTEEQRMSLDSFLHDIKEITGTSIPSAVIRKTEPVLLEGIKFHLAPLHPYASLSAFMHDFGTLLERTGTPLDNMEQVFATATATARGALATDVLFIATPGLIALASLVDACNMHQVYQEQVQRYLDSKSTANAALSQRVTELCDTLSQQRQNPFDPSLASKAEKKLRKVRKTMAVFEERIEEQQRLISEQEDAIKRERKLEEIRRREKETEDFLMGGSSPDPNDSFSLPLLE